MLKPEFHIITIGIIATLAMTAFSYLLSAITKRNFREPRLINLLLKRATIISTHLCSEHIIGWAIHLFIGILFVACFLGLTVIDIFQINYSSGFLFGCLAGTVGAVFWGITLKLHPDPPKLKKIWYLIQLIPAHIVFGVVMIALLKCME